MVGDYRDVKKADDSKVTYFATASLPMTPDELKGRRELLRAKINENSSSSHLYPSVLVHLVDCPY